MKVGLVIIPMVLMLSKKSHSITVSSIDCGGVCSATIGSSYTLTCRWSGTLQYGITWKKDGSMVVTCGTATCLPSVAGYANGSYLNSQMAQLHIASFSNADVGNWSCSDGNDTSKTCRTTPARRNIALEASCKRVGRSRLVTCTLNDHGSPPITLEMRSKDDVVDSTTSEGQLKRTYLGSRVSSYTCAVAGERSECVTPKSKSTTCGDFEVLIAGSVIIVILIPCVVGCLLYIKCANKRRLCLSFYIINGTLLAAGVVLLVMIFIRNTDYNDPLFLSAAFIVFAGLIVGIVASIILHKCHVNSSH